MSQVFNFFVLFSLFVLSIACKKDPGSKDLARCHSQGIEKKLSVKLPIQLQEISGIAFIKKLNQWVVVNDEKGSLYFLNKDFELLNTKKFGPKGDYEGVEVVDSFVYVVNSKGDIYRYNYVRDIKSKPWKTPLSSKNNIEGLGYDNKKNALLIACKGSPHIHKKKKKLPWKAIYSYSLENYSLSDKPILKLSKNAIRAFYLKSNSEVAECLTRINRFSPSGISYLETKDLFYTLSAHGNLIVVSDRNSEIKNLIFLDKTHPQAEGIYVSDQGQIVISDEAKELYGKITSYDF